MTSLRHNHQDGEPREPRDAYLDAARDCILDVGWRRTTLTEVARRASVSRMTIYRTWADMPTLLGDLMTREWTQVVAESAAAASSATGAQADPVDRLVARLLATVAALRENELFVRIVEVDPELVLPYLVARRGRSQELIVALLAEELAAAQASGHVRPGDPVALARTLVLTAHGFVLSAHTMTDEAVSAEALDAELAVVLERGLRA